MRHTSWTPLLMSALMLAGCFASPEPLPQPPAPVTEQASTQEPEAEPDLAPPEALNMATVVAVRAAQPAKGANDNSKQPSLQVSVRLSNGARRTLPHPGSLELKKGDEVLVIQDEQGLHLEPLEFVPPLAGPSTSDVPPVPCKLPNSWHTLKARLPGVPAARAISDIPRESC